MARTSKLTAELQTQLVQLIRAGNTIEVSADTVGLGVRTFHEWMTRGGSSKRADEPYRQFKAAIEQARVECEASLVTRIAKASANGSWGAAAWLLERRFPERWAKPEKQPAAKPDDEPTGPFADLDAADELATRRAKRETK